MNRHVKLTPFLVLAAATLVAGPATAGDPIPGADVAPAHADALPGALTEAELSTVDAGTAINTTRSNIRCCVQVISVDTGPQGSTINTTRSNIKNASVMTVQVTTGPLGSTINTTRSNIKNTTTIQVTTGPHG